MLALPDYQEAGPLCWQWLSPLHYNEPDSSFILPPVWKFFCDSPMDHNSKLWKQDVQYKHHYIKWGVCVCVCFSFFQFPFPVLGGLPTKLPPETV